MPIRLKFESSASKSDICARAFRDPELRLRREEIRKLQAGQKQVIESVRKALLGPLPKDTPEPPRLALPSLRDPKNLDLHEEETHFQWRNEQGARVKMTEGEEALHTAFARLSILLSAVNGLLKGISAMKARADSAKRRLERDLDYIEEITTELITIDMVSTLTSEASIEKFLEEEIVNENQKIMLSNLLRAQLQDRIKDVADMKAGENLPDGRALEQFASLDQHEKTVVEKIFQTPSIDDQQGQQLQELLQNLIGRAEKVLKLLNLPLPETPEHGSARLKQLIDESMVCEFLSSEPPEKDYGTLIAVSGLVVLAVALTIAGLKMTSNPGSPASQTTPSKR